MEMKTRENQNQNQNQTSEKRCAFSKAVQIFHTFGTLDLIWWGRASKMICLMGSHQFVFNSIKAAFWRYISIFFIVVVLTPIFRSLFLPYKFYSLFHFLSLQCHFLPLARIFVEVSIESPQPICCAKTKFTKWQRTKPYNK